MLIHSCIWVNYIIHIYMFIITIDHLEKSKFKQYSNSM